MRFALTSTIVHPPSGAEQRRWLQRLAAGTSAIRELARIFSDPMLVENFH